MLQTEITKVKEAEALKNIDKQVRKLKIERYRIYQPMTFIIVNFQVLFLTFMRHPVLKVYFIYEIVFKTRADVVCSMIHIFLYNFLKSRN